MTREPIPDDSPNDDGRTSADRPANPKDTTDADGQSRLDPPAVEKLAEHLWDLETVDPAADTEDLEPLREVIADRTIISLGEATHGTREFFRLKHRLVRFLVEALDFRLFGLEANFAKALAIDRYVRDGEGTAEAALAGLDFWIWDTEEVLALVEWLRAFNAGRPAGDRVRFYGIDAQFTGGAAEAVEEYLDGVDPMYLESIRDDLEPLINPGLWVWPAEEQDEQRAAVDRLVPDLRRTFDERRAAYVARSSEPAWEVARQHVTVLEQVQTLARAAQAAPGGLSDETLRIRDRAMADNVAWILDHEPGDRLVLWAHNGHVNRIEATANGHSAPSMGRHLARSYGEDYYALGFEFGAGSFQTLTEGDGDQDGSYELGEQALDEPIAGTIGSVLTGLDCEVGFLDIETAVDDPALDALFDEEHRLHSIGAVYDPAAPDTHVDWYVLADAFDGLCYVDETSRARPLDRE